jgi:hypothetical protein
MPLGLVQIVAKQPVSTDPLPRLWLIFFSDAGAGSWWRCLFRPGFRHVSAAAWFAGAERWVYYNPTWRGTVIDVATDAEFGPRFQQMVDDSTAILRVRSGYDRGNAPAVTYCVGAIKALLGIRSCALGPWGLYRHLLATGAEVVSRPSEDTLDVTVETSTSSARGSGDHGAAEGGSAARGGRQGSGDAAAIEAGNAAA